MLNGLGTAEKPKNPYKSTTYNATELKRRAANYSETGVGVGGGGFERCCPVDWMCFDYCVCHVSRDTSAVSSHRGGASDFG